MPLVAEFSFNQSTFSLNEQDGEFIICVELLSEVTLDREIDLEFLFGNVSAAPSDLINSNLTFTFPIGSQSGHTECNTVGVNEDGIVEDREEFVIFLRPNPSVSDVAVGSGAKIFIEDSPQDGKYSFMYVIQLTMVPILTWYSGCTPTHQ